MLCVCHTTPTQNGSVYSLLLGWATMTGRLLGLMDATTRYPASGVEPRFCNLSITSLALY